MDLTTRKSRWKIYLALVGATIVVITMIYTSFISKKLAEEEKNKAATLAIAQQDLDKTDEEFSDYTLHLNILTSNTTIPTIIVNDRGGIDEGINFGPELDTDIAYLKKEVMKLINAGYEPIKVGDNYVYHKESKILTQLRFFPFIQLFLIAGFVIFGYIGLNSARKAEQNRVWVGMAKETAHQLGTPISAIVAWIEHLKLMREKDKDTQEILGELRNDVNRLELIADRFSKIGSAPKMESIDLYEELEKCRAYMERRAPRKVNFLFPAQGHNPIFIDINPPLFDWVIENLLRNALDAMDGKGQISAQVLEEKNQVIIEVSDTGKGIPAAKFKTVFQPGFTTKKRGWGLGLSLAKRIIEEYHSGKIFVKKSIEGKGTTFVIRLPKN